MSRLPALVRLEVGLWLRSFGFWLAVAALHLWSVPAWLDYGRTALLTTRRLGDLILGDAVPFAGLFVLFASAGAMLRDRTERTDELVDPLPVSNLELVLARWLAGAALWAPAGLVLFGVNAALLVRQPDAVLEPWPLGSFIAAHYLPSVLLLHTLGVAAGALVARPLVLYPVLTALWGGMAVGSVELFRHQPGWDILALAHPTGIQWFMARPSDLAGFYPEEPFLFWRRVFQAGLALLVLALSASLYRRHRERGDARRRRRQARVAVAAVLAGSVALLGGFGATEPYRAPGDDRALLEAGTTHDLAAERYDLAAAVDPEAGSYAVTAAVRVRNRGARPLETLGLLLGPDCRVRGVRAAGGDTHAQLAFRQAGLLLAVTPEQPLAPSTSVTLQFAYDCAFYRPATRLPAPVRVPPVLTGIQYPGSLYPRPPAAFNLTAVVPEDFRLVANIPQVGSEPAAEGWVRLFYRGEVPDLDVFGARYAAERVAGLDLYYLPSHRVAMRNFARLLAERLAFYRRYLGEPEWVPGVTPLPLVVEVPSRFPVRGVVSLGDDAARQYYNPAALDPGSAYMTELDSSAPLAFWWGEAANAGSMTTPGWLGASDLTTPIVPPQLGLGITTEVERGVMGYLVLLFRADQQGSELYRAALEMMGRAWGVKDGAAELRRAAWDWQLARRAGVDQFGMVQLAIWLTLDNVRQHLGDEGLRRVIDAVRQGYLTRARAALADPPRDAGAGAYDYLELERRQAERLLQAIAGLPGAGAVYDRALERLRLAVQGLEASGPPGRHGP